MLLHQRPEPAHLALGDEEDGDVSHQGGLIRDSFSNTNDTDNIEQPQPKERLLHRLGID